MTYKILIYSEKRWNKDLAIIPRSDQIKILNALQGLSTEPWPQNLKIKKLKEYPGAQYRLRVGKYRVLLDADKRSRTILIYRALDRNKLY